jgi:hypothetical protein
MLKPTWIEIQMWYEKNCWHNTVPILFSWPHLTGLLLNLTCNHAVSNFHTIITQHSNLIMTWNLNIPLRHDGRNWVLWSNVAVCNSKLWKEITYFYTNKGLIFRGSISEPSVDCDKEIQGSKLRLFYLLRT